MKSVTHNANPRPCPNKERRRSRGNRKSCKSHPCVFVPCSISVPTLCPCTLSHLHVPVPSLCPCPDAFSQLCVPVPLPFLFVSVAMPCPISVSLFPCSAQSPYSFTSLSLSSIPSPCLCTLSICLIPSPCLCALSSCLVLCVLVPMPYLAPSPWATLSPPGRMYPETSLCHCTPLPLPCLGRPPARGDSGTQCCSCCQCHTLLFPQCGGR